MPQIKKKEIINFIYCLIHPKQKVFPEIYFPADELFWNDLVRIGSNHQVLPAIYQGILRKKIQKYIPKNLLNYLMELCEINSLRNRAIIHQINFICDILNNNKIDYVLIKGAAILISKNYDSINQRMLGDIDILISKNHLTKAQNLLMSKGFYETKVREINLTEDILDFRHLNRLIHKDYIASVELHSKITNENIQYYSDLDLFKNNQLIDSCIVPSKENQWKIAIYNSQINDIGMQMNFIYIKTVLDVINLEPSEVDYVVAKSDKIIKHFYSLLSLHYNNYTAHYGWKKTIYSLQINNKWLFNINRVLVKFTNTIYLILNRLCLLVKSKKFRKKIFTNRSLITSKLKRIWKL